MSESHRYWISLQVWSQVAPAFPLRHTPNRFSQSANVILSPTAQSPLFAVPNGSYRPCASPLLPPFVFLHNLTVLSLPTFNLSLCQSLLPNIASNADLSKLKYFPFVPDL